MGDFVAAVEAAYTDQGNGDFDILPRQNFEVEVPASNRKGSLKIGGGSLLGVGVMGASLYSGGYGGMNLWVTLYDTATGKVLAILHGSYIGQMKTGATAAMAAKHLSRADSKTVGILGLSFKPETDDMRDAASIPMINGLLADGATVRVFDPAAMENAKEVLASGVEYCTDSYDAATGADILVILTEWNQFRSLDLERIHGLLKQPLVVDLCNVYERARMEEKGFRYVSVGRAAEDLPEA